MDDAAASRIAHGGLALMNSMSDAATDDAIDLLALAPACCASGPTGPARH